MNDMTLSGDLRRLPVRRSRLTLAGPEIPVLGVAIVTFNSASVILDCLESLLASRDVRLRIVIVDNNSPDDTVARLRNWASGLRRYAASPDIPFGIEPCAKPVWLHETPRPVPLPDGCDLMLIHAGINGGYAAGVNAALSSLAADPAIDRFWILNPDSVVTPEAARRLALHGGKGARFGILGGRIAYLDRPDVIQIDGGRIDWRTGVTYNVNQGRSVDTAPAPDPAGFDFISGASMVVSRHFLDQAGPMPEHYFLYYEEVEWALRRGDLPLAHCAGALVLHRAGSSIGSPRPGFEGSSLAIYFRHRNRLRFLRRHRWHSWPGALAFSLAKAGQVAARGHPAKALTLIAASLGMRPPASVRSALEPACHAAAFARPARLL